MTSGYKLLLSSRELHHQSVLIWNLSTLELLITGAFLHYPAFILLSVSIIHG